MLRAPSPEEVRRSVARAVRRSQADALRRSLRLGDAEAGRPVGGAGSTVTTLAPPQVAAVQPRALVALPDGGVRRTVRLAAAGGAATVTAVGAGGARRTVTLVSAVPTDARGMPVPPMPIPPVVSGHAAKVEARRKKAADKGKMVRLPLSCFDCMHFGTCRNGFDYDLEHLPQLSGFKVRRFVWGPFETLVYSTDDLGQGKPGVLLLHELPGFTPKVLALARRLSDAGMHVVCPILFGVVNAPYGALYLYRERLRVIKQKELGAWKLNKTPPIVDMLRALAVETHIACGGRGIATVGMDLTACMALAAAVQPSVVASVLLHPWKPYSVSAKAKADIGISPQTKLELMERAEAGLEVLGVRFLGDRLVQPSKFAELERLLGSQFTSLEVPGTGHYVLTEHYVDSPGHVTREALGRVTAFLLDKLTHGPSHIQVPSAVVVEAPEDAYVEELRAEEVGLQLEEAEGLPAAEMLHLHPAHAVDAKQLVLVDWYCDAHGA